MLRPSANMQPLIDAMAKRQCRSRKQTLPSENQTGGSNASLPRDRLLSALYSKPPVRAVINKEFNSQTPCWAPCAKGIFKRKKFCQGQSPKRLRSFFAPPKHSRTKNWTPTRHRSTSKAPQGLSFLSLMPILKAIHHLAIRTFQNCQLKSSQAR